MFTAIKNQLELTNRHLAILHQVLEKEPIGIVSLATETGYPQYKVRYSLRILEEDGLIEPTAQGAIITEDAASFVEASATRMDALVSKLERLQTETNEEVDIVSSSAG